MRNWKKILEKAKVDGLTRKQIAESEGVTKQMVSLAIKKYGIRIATILGVISAFEEGVINHFYGVKKQHVKSPPFKRKPSPKLNQVQEEERKLRLSRQKKKRQKRRKKGKR